MLSIIILSNFVKLNKTSTLYLSTSHDKYSIIKVIVYFIYCFVSVYYNLIIETSAVYRLYYTAIFRLLVFKIFDSSRALLASLFKDFLVQRPFLFYEGFKPLQFDNWKAYIIDKNSIQFNASDLILNKDNYSIKATEICKITCNKVKEVTSSKKINISGNGNELNIIYGFLLGDSFIDKKERKVIFIIKDRHITYMTNIHKILAERGICNNSLPKISTSLEKKGKLMKVLNISTFSNDFYLELYNKWYDNNCNHIEDQSTSKRAKILPQDFYYYFNIESLAYWLMTYGKIKNNFLFINMKEFTHLDILYMKEMLEKKYKLDNIILSNHMLMFNKNNIKIIYNLIERYIIPSMKFKFI